MAGVDLLQRFLRISQRGKQTSGKPKQWEWMRGSRGWVSNMSASIISLFAYARWDGRDMCAVKCVGRVTYSITPAAQQVVGHGVLRLQLDGFIQMILGGEAGRQTDRQKIFTVDSWHGCYFHCLLFWPDLSCFTNPQVFHKHLSHTRSSRATTHSQLSHTLPRSFPFSLSLIQSAFFSYLPSLALYLSLVHLSRVLKLHSVCGKPLTGDKMLRAVVPHFTLCNRLAVWGAYWRKIWASIPLYYKFMGEVMPNVYMKNVYI